MEVRPKCPNCNGELSFVCSWTFRGLWGYEEVRTFECAAHGPIFIRARTPVEQAVVKGADKPPHDGDRDSLVSTPRRPTPPPNANAIAVPEPVEPKEPLEPNEPLEP